MDTINSPIRYTFVSGVPESYKEYFRIDPDTGAVHQVKAVDTSTTKLFNVIIKVKNKFTIRQVESLNNHDQYHVLYSIKMTTGNSPKHKDLIYYNNYRHRKYRKLNVPQPLN